MKNDRVLLYRYCKNCGLLFRSLILLPFPTAALACEPSHIHLYCSVRSLSFLLTNRAAWLLKMLLKPRSLALCLIALIITVLTFREDSRTAAHSALTSVGVPLPVQISDVDLGLDHVKAGFHKWTGGIVGAGGAAWDAEEDEEEILNWENTTASADGIALADHDEPLVNKMVYHPKNGYLLLPDPSKDHALKPLEEERHPILELIENAERKWDALVERQSKTLQEAVAEYKVRYQRNPPKGFDIW